MELFDSLRELKKDDTLRFGQWLYNLIYESFNPELIPFIDIQAAIAEKLYNIHDDTLIRLIFQAKLKRNENELKEWHKKLKKELEIKVRKLNKPTKFCPLIKDKCRVDCQNWNDYTVHPGNDSYKPHIRDDGGCGIFPYSLGDENELIKLINS